METEVETSEQENTAAAVEPAAEAVAAAANVQLSQRDYRPTPYKQSAWEIVGELCKVREFVAMSMPIIRDDRLDADPMFAVFDGPNRAAELSQETFVYGGKDPEADAKPDEKMVHEAELLALTAQYEAELQQAVLAAEQRGKAEAEAAANAQLEALKADVAAFTTHLSEEWKGLAEKLEKQAFDLALKISHKILRTTADIKPEYILEVIREGLKNVGAAKPVKIRVSPQDYEFLQVVGVPLDLSEEELGMKYEIDDTIRAGCVIETDFGDVDLELERMWTQVKETLYAGVK